MQRLGLPVSQHLPPFLPPSLLPSLLLQGKIKTGEEVEIVGLTAAPTKTTVTGGGGGREGRKEGGKEGGREGGKGKESEKDP